MICEKNKCTGCYACKNICPKNCIEMKEDEIGYIYPIIDEKKCIECGLCKKICPSINKVKLNKPKKAYAMYNKDEKIREQSVSGGAATTFYTYILKNNGVVYGCSNLENNEIHFLRITDINDLYKLKGSKYVHAYIKDTFKLVKEDLINNKLVLFIGTPCQVAGLKNYLGKEYTNLYLIDLICHGVPSQKLLIEEIKSHNIEINRGGTELSFRDKDGFKFKVYKDNKNIFEQDMYKNCYWTGFFDGVFYRPNCYECMYATSNRVSDMTIGDFWELSEESKLFDKDQKGVSLLLPITDKGEKLIDECKKEMVIEERPIEEAINGNTQLRRPSKKTEKEKKFKDVYIKKGYKKACKTFMRGKSIKYYIKNTLKKNKQIYKIGKKIKNKIKGK